MVKNFLFIYLFYLTRLLVSRFCFFGGGEPSLSSSPAPRKAEAPFLLEGCFFVPSAMKVWLRWLAGWSVCKACLPMSCVCQGAIGAADTATRMSPFPQLPFTAQFNYIVVRRGMSNINSRAFSFSFSCFFS